MITVDIPLPDRCLNCPMSHCIMSGDFEGEMMCSGLESKGIELRECLVNGFGYGRPVECPIKEEKQKFFIDENGKITPLPVIVRCKDCMYRFVDGDNVRFNMCLLNHNKVQPDDWFCADGERSE